MGKKTKLNGFELYSAPSREDRITNRKLIKGALSNTFEQDDKTKIKTNAAIESVREETEQFEEMLKNPSFGLSRLQGGEFSSKQLIHGYRYQHSIGDIDFIVLEGVEVDDYAIKVNNQFINRDDWEWILDEPFRSTADTPSGAFADYSSIVKPTNSSGDDLQSRTLSWMSWSGSPSTSILEQIEGDQSMRLQGEAIRLQLNKLYSNYELSFYFQFASGSTYLSTALDFSGYAGANDYGFPVKFDFANSQIGVSQQYTTSTASSTITTPFTFIQDVWYHAKILRLGSTISIFIDSVFVASWELESSIVGDIGWYGNDVYIDQVRMRVLPTSLLTTPVNSEVTSYQQTETVDGFFGKQERIFAEDLIRFKHGASQDAKLFLPVNEEKGNVLNDKTSNENNGLIRNGQWVEDGYLGYGVRLSNGDIIVEDDSSISDLSEFMLHIRFKLDDLEDSSGVLEINPIASKGVEWIVYDYKKDTNVHYIAFEIYGEVLIGDELVEGEWNEFFFLCDGKSSFIYRSDETGLVQPEARKVLGNLQLYLPLDEAQKDRSIYNKTITDTVISYSAGKFNNAGNFDGSTSQVSIPNFDISNQQFSFSMWFKADTITANDGLMGCQTYLADGFELFFNTSTTLFARYNYAASTKQAQVKSGMQTGIWYHLVWNAYYDGANYNVDLYMNGDLFYSLINVNQMVSPNDIFYIGRKSLSFDGLIDEVKVQNKKLSQEEIDFLYAKGNYKDDLYINSQGYESSNNTLSLDHVALYDKFVILYKHWESLFNVRCWKLPEDEIGNPMMRSLIFNAPFDEGEGAYSKLKNIYSSNSYMNQSGGVTTEWTTDTYSPLKKHSVLCDDNSWLSGADDENDLNNNIRIYEATFSFWVNMLEYTGNSCLETMVDGGTSGFHIILAQISDSSFIEYGNGSNHHIALTRQFDLNTWYKIDITFSYGITKLYVNGDLEITSDDSGSLTYYLPATIDYKLLQTLKRYMSDIKIYDRTLTSDEIKQSFISDPIEPYYLQNIVFSKKHNFDRNDSIFIENGLFGIHIYKGLYAEAKRTIGAVEFKYWDKGWESIGILRIRNNNATYSELGVMDFKILEITPNKIIVRVKMDGNDSGNNVAGYHQELFAKGESGFIDIILESGKYGATIIPRWDVHTDWEFELATNYYSFSNFFEIGVLGFNDVHISELHSSVSETDLTLPQIMLGFRKNDNLILGFGSNRAGDLDMVSIGHTTTETLMGLRFRRFNDDPLNEKYVFTVFAKKYYDPSDADLVLFMEAEDLGTPSVDGTASGGNNVTYSSGTVTWIIGTLKKGSYLAWIRLKGSGSPQVRYTVRKDATAIENYAMNINTTLDFVPSGSYTFYAIPFVVDDDTASYDIDASRQLGTLNLDCLGIIPLSNGKSSVMDLYHQGFTINNQKYIGAL